MTGKLTLGPLFTNWSSEKRRDFYFRIADEAPVDDVYLGEVVCSKREPFYADMMEEVEVRLYRAGKRVIRSTLALLTLPREMERLEALAKGNQLVEANDVAAFQFLKGRPFVVGPFINVMNEGAFDMVVAEGARRVVFASELRGTSIRFLAARAPDVEKEVQVFGRQPLAVSMRCYHARAHGRDKDHCRIVCAQDEEGMEAQSLDGVSLYAINGTQTLTHGFLLLLKEMEALVEAGVTHFRLSPQRCDMVRVAQLYRAFLDGKSEADSVCNELKSMAESVGCINGFYHGVEGRAFIPAAQ